jgi:dihydrofolate reductase
MAGLNNEGQWIILMAFIISVGIFFLAILLNQSVLVGQTTAESVLDFPKNDIQDMHSEVWVIFSRYKTDNTSRDESINDIEKISLVRKTATVEITPRGINSTNWRIHYNNGITNYTEVVDYDVTNYDRFHY